jgi:hypothetical protein
MNIERLDLMMARFNGWKWEPIDEQTAIERLRAGCGATEEEIRKELLAGNTLTNGYADYRMAK